MGNHDSKKENKIGNREKPFILKLLPADHTESNKEEKNKAVLALMVIDPTETGLVILRIFCDRYDHAVYERNGGVSQIVYDNTKNCCYNLKNQQYRNSQRFLPEESFPMDQKYYKKQDRQ